MSIPQVPSTGATNLMNATSAAGSYTPPAAQQAPTYFGANIRFGAAEDEGDKLELSGTDATAPADENAPPTDADPADGDAANGEQAAAKSPLKKALFKFALAGALAAAGFTILLPFMPFAVGAAGLVAAWGLFDLFKGRKSAAEGEAPPEDAPDSEAPSDPDAAAESGEATAEETTDVETTEQVDASEDVAAADTDSVEGLPAELTFGEPDGFGGTGEGAASEEAGEGKPVVMDHGCCTVGEEVEPQELALSGEKISLYKALEQFMPKFTTLFQSIVDGLPEGQREVKQKVLDKIAGGSKTEQAGMLADMINVDVVPRFSNLESLGENPSGNKTIDKAVLEELFNEMDNATARFFPQE